MPAGLEITDAVPGTSTGFCVVLLGFKVSLGKVKSESPGAFVSNSTPRNSYTKYDLNQNLRLKENCCFNLCISFPCKSGEICLS